MGAEPPPIGKPPARFDDHKLWETWPHVGHAVKRSLALSMQASHFKSAPFGVHKVVLTWPTHLGVMRIYRLRLLAIWRPSSKSCGHKHFCSGYIMFLICQTTSHEHMFKKICTFMDGNSFRWVNTLLCLVASSL